MTFRELIDELGRLGVSLASQGNTLRYHPASKVPPYLVAMMKLHKAELLKSIQGIEGVVVVKPTCPWCPRYRHPKAWRSIYGSHLICARCHPPCRLSVVAEWVSSLN